MDIDLLPVFWYGKKAYDKFTQEELDKLSQMASDANVKWTALYKKYPGKTAREILKLEAATPVGEKG